MSSLWTDLLFMHGHIHDPGLARRLANTPSTPPPGVRGGKHQRTHSPLTALALLYARKKRVSEPSFEQVAGAGRSESSAFPSQHRSHTASDRWRNTVKEIVFLVEESDEGGFIARALGESIFTQADSMDVLREAVRDAVRCHFGENGGPSVIRLHYVRDEVLAA